MTTASSSPTTKIVIVSGQEFSVPIGTDNEAIRQQLAQNFPDLASAAIQKGRKTIEGVEYETIEFVKKAGTKGMDGVALAALLAHIPPSAVPTHHGLTRQQHALLQRLAEGQLPIGEALAGDGHTIDAAFRACAEACDSTRSQGEQLCAPCDTLGAVAASAPCAW